MQELLMYLFIFIGTIGGTLLGAIFGIISLKFPKKLLSSIQNLAIGSIIGLIFLELFPHSIEGIIIKTDSKILGTIYASLIIFITALLFLLIHELIHHFSHHHDKNPTDNESCEDHGHTKDIFNNQKSLLISSFIFLAAISVHNIPEGLSLGIIFTTLNEANIPLSGLIVSTVLFIHNVLVGFSMAQSFKASQKSNVFSILITSLSGLLSFIFGIIGYYLNISMNEFVSSIIIAISTGSLLYVLFIELLPEVFYKYKTKYTFIFVLLGILLTSILLAL